MFLNLLIVTLATVESLDIWFHSSLMAHPRAHVENWDGKAGELLRCRFCLAPWTALVLFVALIVGYHLPWWGGLILQGPVVALAVAKVAGWLHDLADGFENVPRFNELPDLIDKIDSEGTTTRGFVASDDSSDSDTKAHLKTYDAKLTNDSSPGGSEQTHVRPGGAGYHEVSSYADSGQSPRDPQCHGHSGL